MVFLKILLFFCLSSQKWIEVVNGILLLYLVIISSSFYIGHFGQIILNANSTIGEYCNLSQGVTIGVSGGGGKRGVPTIENNVYIKANSTVAGSIAISDNIGVGSNSLVVNNVAPVVTVVRVPLVILNNNNNNSSRYI